MTTELNSVMVGAAAMASLVAALFFLRFWRQSRDGLLLWFSVAFGLDAATRLLLGLGYISDEHQPFFYLGSRPSSLLSSPLQKNWPRKLSK